MADKKDEPQTARAFAWQESTPALVVIILFNLFGAYVFGAMGARSGSAVGYVFAVVFVILAVAQGARLYRKMAKT